MERLSDRARQVLDAAEDEVYRLDHPHIGTEHLLLGLFSVDNPARDVLLAAGATADGTRAKVVEAVGKRDPRQRGEPELSARAKRAIDRASRLSLQRRDPELEPAHLLLGILDVEGRAGQVLRGLGVDVGALQKDAKCRLDTAIPAAPEPPAQQAAVAVGPRCLLCESDVGSTGLGYRLVDGVDEVGGRRQFVVVFCAACGSVLGTNETAEQKLAPGPNRD